MLVFLSLIIVGSNDFITPVPTGDWLGILYIRPITYRVYLTHSANASRLFILNPKANEIPLDTLFFRNDSLYFSRGDFSSTFAGLYKKSTNTIHGYWTDDAHKKHLVTFQPVNPDTLTGLHPRNTNTYLWKKPAQQTDGLKTCDLQDQNINRTLLDSLTYSIMREKFPNIHSLLIARNNFLLYEEYFYGWKAADLWLIQSVTKSFTSALTGIALSRGEIKNLDEPICSYLTKYKDKVCNAQNKDITIRQLLTMRTGLEWNELEFDYYDKRNSAYQCAETPDPFDCLFSHRRINTEGTVFAYNSLNHSMMNMILRKSTGLRNPKELTQRLLQPLGIEKVNPGGEGFGVIGDISITPRDMLKFGLLYLNDGQWNGQQVVPTTWVKESTAAKIQIGPGEGYGYFWWIKQFMVNGKPVNCFYAWGYAGQYIFVVPDRQLVVAMTATNWIMDEKKYAFDMMQEFVLPACE